MKRRREAMELRFSVLETAVQVAFFDEVENSSELRALIVKKNPPQRVAFVDAKVVASLTHVKSAAFNAVRRWRRATPVVTKNDAPKSRTLETEFIYCLSPSTGVGDALGTFGIQDDTSQLLVVSFDDQGPDLTVVRGTQRDVADLRGDDDLLKKTFQLSDKELALHGNLEAAILTRLAAKDC